MTTNKKFATVRGLAAQSHAQGDQTAWFETLYSSAAQGKADIPWADLAPNSLLVGNAPTGPGTAGVVGCGLGDDAQYLASLGWDVTAFDISPTAVKQAQARFPDSPVTYTVADVLDPPQSWAFDFVLEIYTVQVLRDAPRRKAIANIASLVAPGGTLMVIARHRAEDDELAAFPWPLAGSEIDSFAQSGLRASSIEKVWDHQDPPVLRWRAIFNANRD
ncbi:class I SAM-dependent methyltransferase [Natronoglycomyces albus]|uniref:Class I SAM-dependent methyltransferase n=1 Tax=Natronoglycomyces albus TaxID=2811108 RepID=A0A895XKR3_9ACTN|nr:class I SAM-dependent methyltransferase [Natronoglycomyces albus]QSB04153.1 class I SAM-dependent methyltransferase [Natronoglycomyces albus]